MRAYSTLPRPASFRFQVPFSAYQDPVGPCTAGLDYRLLFFHQSGLLKWSNIILPLRIIRLSSFTSADWKAGASTDPLSDLYSDSSFQLTQTDGGTATFIFNGTSFTIFGSKRGNHGFYQVTVDGDAFAPDSGAAPDPGDFQVALFSSPPLIQGLHTVTLTNQGNSFVDVDFITWESSIGTEAEQLVVNTVQDTDPAFTYTPANSWGTNPPSIGTYSGSSGHGTATPGAFMTYTFEVGDGVSLYGPVGPAGSPFSVSVDGGNPTGYTANKQFFHPQVLLYAATNLGAGQHTVKVAYEPKQPGQIFAIDYAEVYT
ncbi:hypothetical protein C8R46DRAFT_1242606, partial [Mycena filopes]